MESESSNIYSICHKIKESNPNEDEKIHSAYHLLLKMFNNIISNPNESKYRGFKLTNEAIKSKILVIKETLELLKEAGYVEVDKENLSFKDIKTDRLKKAADVISIYYKDLEEKIKQKEIFKKNEELARLNNEIKEKFREEQRKKQEILKQLELDKQERAQAEKATDSYGKDLKYGATLKKFECKNQRG